MHLRKAASETHLINTKLSIKILLCKIMLSEKFRVFQKNSFIKKSVEQSKNKKEIKKHHKKLAMKVYQV